MTMPDRLTLTRPILDLPPESTLDEIARKVAALAATDRAEYNAAQQPAATTRHDAPKPRRGIPTPQLLATMADAQLADLCDGIAVRMAAASMLEDVGDVLTACAKALRAAPATSSASAPSGAPVRRPRQPAKRIPVKVAQDVADAYGQRQVIIVTWDGVDTYHTVTYGADREQCRQAAAGGRKISAALGWTSAAQQAPAGKRADGVAEELPPAVGRHDPAWGMRDGAPSVFSASWPSTAPTPGIRSTPPTLYTMRPRRFAVTELRTTGRGVLLHRGEFGPYFTLTDEKCSYGPDHPVLTKARDERGRCGWVAAADIFPVKARRAAAAPPEAHAPPRDLPVCRNPDHRDGCACGGYAPPRSRNPDKDD